jgi:hypothetical protein
MIPLPRQNCTTIDLPLDIPINYLANNINEVSVDSGHLIMVEKGFLLFLLQNDTCVYYLNTLTFFINKNGIGIRFADFICQIKNHR